MDRYGYPPECTVYEDFIVVAESDDEGLKVELRCVDKDAFAGSIGALWVDGLPHEGACEFHGLNLLHDRIWDKGNLTSKADKEDAVWGRLQVVDGIWSREDIAGIDWLGRRLGVALA